MHNDLDNNNVESWRELSELAVIEQEPTRARYLVYALVCVVSLILLWSAWATVDTVSRGQGKVIPSRQVQVVGSQDGGVVQDILVREGDFVEAGQLLLRLDSTRSEANRGENRASLTGLQIRAARLSALAESEDFEPSGEMLELAPDVVAEEVEVYRSSLAEFDAKKRIASENLSALKARRDQLEEDVRLKGEELEFTRPLVATGAAAPIEVTQLQIAVNNARGELRQTRAAIRQAEAEITKVDAEFLKNTREQLAETLTRIDAMSQTDQGLLDRVTQADVISPVRGTVKQLHYNTVGGVVLPGRDIVELVPADDTLLLEVRISPRDIAFLAPGQAANVKFTAYDFVVYGGLKGVIEQIGADTLIDASDEPYYKVTVRTEEVDFGPDKPIIPGMTVEVDVLTGQKTVLAYLMKPVLRARQNALSER